MTPEELDAKYAEADAAGQQVAATAAAYQAATRNRALVFKQLRDAGQSVRKMSQRLGLSVSRVGQILGRADAPDVDRRQS